MEGRDREGREARGMAEREMGRKDGEGCVGGKEEL